MWAPAAAHPRLRGPDLQHRDADPALGAAGQRPRQSGPVAVRLEEERDRAHSVEPGHRVDPVAGVEDGLVPGRDDGVEADPAARAEGVDREVPALGDQRDAALVQRAPPSPPRAGARGPTEMIPLQLGPQTGSPRPRAISASSRSSGSLASTSPKPAERTMAPPQPRSIASASTAATPAAGIADDHRVHRLGQLEEARHAGTPEHLVALRVDPPDLALVAGRRDVPQDVVAVGTGRGRWPRPRRPSGGGGAASGPVPFVFRTWQPGRAAAQRRIGPTPRRSRPRATISRWISLVPSQIRSTRSSRRKRSATLERM